MAARPQVIFVVANHSPLSRVLHRELRDPKTGDRADYFVATVQYMGYAMFKENMVPLDEFIAKLDD